MRGSVHGCRTPLLPIVLALFVGLPILEIYLLLKLGEATSAEVAVGVVIATGIIGGLLARSQGLRVLWRLRDDLNKGKLPADAIVDGAFVLVGGALLLTPGMITDTIGFLMVIPFTRGILKKKLRKLIAARAAQAWGFTIVDFKVKNDSDR